MISRINRSFQQIQFLFYEVRRMNNVHWWRWLNCWFTTSFWAVASYRLERSLFLFFGKAWSAFRIFLSPLIFLLTPWLAHSEIHYRADIGKGLLILHPSIGVVINGSAKIGENLTLTGGNCLGARKKLYPGDFIIGNNVSFGANAVALGPVIIGNYVNIGAGAVVIKDAPDNAVLVGVPAVNINETSSLN